jgi:hypothetical protein
MDGNDKKCTTNLKGQLPLSRASKRGNEFLNLKKSDIFRCRATLTFTKYFIDFVECLPEINCLDSAFC